MGKFLQDNLSLRVQNNMGDFVKQEFGKIRENGITETVSECVERMRYIGSGLTARPGQFSFSANPFMREIVDNLSDSSPILETHVIKPTQVGYTVAAIENYILYLINYGIGPVTLVNGDEAMGKAQMSLRIDEMISSSGIQEKIKPNTTKKKKSSTGDTAEVKQYNNTFLRSIGPNSESKAASLPARILILDEIDKFKTSLAAAGGHVDIVEKLIRRQDSYGVLKKLLTGSTPKSASTSRIEPFVNSGDRRFYNIRCKKCNIQHPLLWKWLKWNKGEDGKVDYKSEMVEGVEVITETNIWHECPGCGYKLREKDKHEVLQEKGHGGTAEWLATKKSDKPFVRSYILNGLYGFRSWLEIVQQWDEVHDDPLKLPDFINDVLGEVWRESGQKPDEHELLVLSQKYEQWNRGHINKDVLFLTVGVDIQEDRIEAMLLGHGRQRQMWVIEYWVFQAEVTTAQIEDKCWNELSEKIKARYKRVGGQELVIQYAFIDSGHNTDTVYLYCSQFPYDEDTMQGVFPVKGQQTQKTICQKSKSDIKTPVVLIHDQVTKRAIYNMLRKKPITDVNFPAHYIHFSQEFGSELYKQITAEEIVPVEKNGEKKGYVILNTKQRRNEALDCLKYAYAAFQFAMDCFFEKQNDYLKSIKKKEIQEDLSMFLDVVEENLMM